MDYRNFFRAALFLPVLGIGLLELGAMLSGPEFTKNLPLFVSSMWMETKIGIQMGWLQYLALSGFLAWRLASWSLQQSLLNGVLAPLYYGIIMLVSLFIYGSLVGDSMAEQVGVFVAIMSLSYGYVYVAAVLASYYVLKHLGVIRT